MLQKPLVAIVGTTASGKSDLAVELALFIRKHQRLFGVSGAEIVSADSRQVYKGFDLTSGKITPKEMRDIRHHMLNVASPSRTYSAARFKREALAVVRAIHKRNALPIVAGGTGFYIDALLYDTSFPNVKPNPTLRAQLEKKSASQLFTLLQKQDPARAAVIDQHNKRRLIRALEIIHATGKPIPLLEKTSLFKTLIIGLAPSQEILKKRIATRIQKRLRAGMLKEVERLHKHGLSWKRLEQFGLEYKWLSLFLQNKISHAEMIAGLQKETEQYAKRQMTWFKRNRETIWLSPEQKKKALTLVKDFLSQN